jgi:tyrosyl-tRNA synthetase
MDKIDEVLTRRVEKVLPDKDGLKALMQERKIKLYNGVDATGKRLHLGHSITIRKLMEFANLGHEVILLFGTGTVLVGDPSERNTGRKLITEKEVEKNIKNWKDQISPLVDFDKIKIMENGDWLKPLKLTDIIQIASNISAVQLFKREMFQRRINAGDTVWYHETMYPILQGYDSVVLDVDLEIGGTDQEFNMLIGRELMKKIKNKEKYVLATPMIMGTDCVWLDDKPKDMFGKLMSLPDDQIVPYMKLVTDLPMEEIGETEKNLSQGSMNPLEAKKKLALAVVTQLHSKVDAEKARDNFEKTFSKGQPEFKEIPLVDGSLLGTITFAAKVSSTEAKRLLSQKAVDVDGVTIVNPKFSLKGGEEIKIGKKIFVKTVKP